MKITDVEYFEGGSTVIYNVEAFNIALFKGNHGWIARVEEPVELRGDEKVHETPNEAMKALGKILFDVASEIKNNDGNFDSIKLT